MKKTNQPWAIGITVFYICFVTTVITTCIVLGQKRFDLVSKDYYSDELAYQGRIDSLARTAQLAEKPAFEVKDFQRVALQFPVELLSRITQGQVTMYRPSDARLDVQVPLTLGETGRQVVLVPHPLHGLWSARVRWQMDGEAYYLEQTVILPEMQTAARQP